MAKLRIKNQQINKYERLQAGAGEQGSAIVIALIVLLLLTVGGIAATQRSTTEAFIVRNSAIHKQNLQLAEMAAMEGVRQLMNLNNANLVVELWPQTTTQDWVHSANVWNDNLYDEDDTDTNSFPLDDDNSFIAGVSPNLAADPVVINTDSTIQTLALRGEDDGNLRYYFIGWRPVPGEAINIGAPALWRQGRVVGEYRSERNGRALVEVGVRLRFGNP